MKKIIVGIIFSILCFGLSACGGNEYREASMNIRNERTWGISGLYIVPVDAEAWGENLIEKYNNGYNLGIDSELLIPLDYFEDSYYQIMIIDVGGNISVCEYVGTQSRYEMVLKDNIVVMKIPDGTEQTVRVRNMGYYESTEVNFEKEMELISRFEGTWYGDEMIYRIFENGDWRYEDIAGTYFRPGIYMYDGKSIYLFLDGIKVEQLYFDEAGLYAKESEEYLH